MGEKMTDLEKFEGEMIVKYINWLEDKLVESKNLIEYYSIQWDGGKKAKEFKSEYETSYSQKWERGGH